MIFKKNKSDIRKYNSLLKRENDRLIKKVERLERERDSAVADKEKAIELLNKYKGEYESLIADARNLTKRQKESEKVMNGIIVDMKKELSDVIKDMKTK